jgi:hypothetical protein
MNEGMSTVSYNTEMYGTDWFFGMVIEPSLIQAQDFEWVLFISKLQSSY